MICRQLCEAYQGFTPLDFERLNQDQILTMYLNMDTLKTGRRLIKGTPKDLAAKGYINLDMPKMSLREAVEQDMQQATRNANDGV